MSGGMRRSVAAAVVAVAVLGAGVASAEAAMYEGAFRGQPTSSITLTFGKHDGKRFLDSWHANFTTNCENGPLSQETLGKPSSRVRHGHFKDGYGSPGDD